MADSTATTTIVLAGPAGSGKSTVAACLHDSLGWPWLDADDLHPAENVALMEAGVPLDDAHREPWLRAVAAWVGEREAAGQDAVVACSALRRRYRDLLRDGHPSVLFAQLEPDVDELARRVESRPDHVFPASLLPSQLETLEELGPDEPGARVPVPRGGSVARTAADVLERLGLGSGVRP